jgi:4-amino-4-deoxy-L-arabinose transferase-like glycosyltransferase
MKFGNIFIERHFLFNASGGAVGGQNFAPLQWYFIYMLDMWKPLIFLMPLVIYAVLQDMNEKKWKYFIPFIWTCSILIPFSLSKSKVWWYIFPMWPPFILLVALSLQHIQKNVKHISLAMLLIISSVIPYWQLTAQHIPLKSFLLFIIITMGVAFGIKKPSAKI